MLKINFGTEGVTFPQGYKANGFACGLKSNGKRDVGMVVSDLPAVTAGTFTSNQFIASPIAYSRKIVRSKGTVRVILANAGNANACCGAYGDKVVSDSTGAVAKEIGISAKEILVFSTGKIGGKLPTEKIVDHLPEILKGLKPKNDGVFSEAILTTDTKKKCKSAEFKVNGKPVRIGCSAKGAGMIEPGMATMLCFITSDIAMPKALLQKTLSEAVSQSFNRITVDGDMSTNDSVVLLANGQSGVLVKTEKDQGYEEFRQSLIEICQTIAKAIVEDGEGATKMLKVSVKGAKTEKDAMEVCRSIGNSMLFKCSLFGESPDWGRILSSVGATKAKINFKNFKASFQGVVFYKNGEPDFKAKEKIKPLLKKKNIEVHIDLGAGNKSTFIWASDLTYEYVKINVV